MILYHGSHKQFEQFDLDCALTGNKKVKFGYGIYLSSSFRSAAHYSYRDDMNHRYVYEVVQDAVGFRIEQYSKEDKDSYVQWYRGWGTSFFQHRVKVLE